MKFILSYFVLFLSLVAFADGGEQKLPAVKGPDDGPTILLLNGGRPWQARINGDHLVVGGARVLNLTGTYLDGFCGTPIREQLSLKDEPTPFDGITPAFKDLSQYKLVILNAMPQELLNKLFTAERVEIMRQYIQQGGKLLCCLTLPVPLGEEVLPVLPTHNPRRFTRQIANIPQADAFSFYPKEIPVPAFNHVTLVPGTEIISELDNEAKTPFLARRAYGQGYVYFFNSTILKDTDSSALHTFSSWAYSNSFYVSLVNYICGTSLNAEKFLLKLPPIPERTQLGEIEVDLQLPVLGVTEEEKSPVMDGEWSAVFANGCKISVLEKKFIQIQYPGEEKPLLQNLTTPKITYSNVGIGYNTTTNERDVNTESLLGAKIRWKLQNMSVDGADVVLKYAAKDAEMQWRFRAGRMQLDGREYLGVSDSLQVIRCPMQLGNIVFPAQINGEKALLAPRNSCYLPPRGFKEFNMDGSVNVDMGNWSFFGSGQPFEMITFQDGVYMGAVDAPFSTEIKLAREAGSAFIESTRFMNLGRVNAPRTTAPYWHWYSKGPVRPHHDFLAMYQFQRQNLRRKAGLDEQPAVPVAADHYVTPAEHKGLLKLAKEKGYRYFKHSHNESPIDSIVSPGQMEAYKVITDAGLAPFIWSAGSYTQGDTGWLYKTHPEWFVRDPKGNIYCYGGNHYPVIDVNNPEFFDWYCTILTKAAKEGGLRGVYRDMDGTAADCVNYATPESPQGLPTQIKFYRFLQDQGYFVQIEGQNPLVQDEYWYRSNLYARNFPGNEYVLVGSMPSASADIYGGVEMDAFRTGMYDCFITYNQGPIYMGLDVVAGSLERGRRGMDLVARFNEAIDATGMPYVRETPFGTCWFGPKGGALFFWNPTKKVKINLPKGWTIKGVNGNILENVPGDAIYLLQRP